MCEDVGEADGGQGGGRESAEATRGSHRREIARIEHAIRNTDDLVIE